jgi:hypothetical protein
MVEGTSSRVELLLELEDHDDGSVDSLAYSEFAIDSKEQEDQHPCFFLTGLLAKLQNLWRQKDDPVSSSSLSSEVSVFARIDDSSSNEETTDHQWRAYETFDKPLEWDKWYLGGSEKKSLLTVPEDIEDSYSNEETADQWQAYKTFDKPLDWDKWYLGGSEKKGLATVPEEDEIDVKGSSDNDNNKGKVLPTNDSYQEPVMTKVTSPDGTFVTRLEI